MSAEAMYLEAVIKYSVFFSTLRTCFLVVLLVATFEGGCYNVIMWLPGPGSLPAMLGAASHQRGEIFRQEWSEQGEKNRRFDQKMAEKCQHLPTEVSDNT